MAFTYKNPLEIAINKLPSKQSDQLLSMTFDKIEERLNLANDFFSFSITPEQQELLTKEGVEIAPVSFKVHSHPVCKMIENHILFKVIPGLLSKFASVAFFSLREEKIKRFLKMFQLFRYGKISNLKHYNAIIDAKDRCRYGDTGFTSLLDRVKALKEDCLKAKKFPKVLLVHDELHFWDPEDVACIFHEIPEIQQIIATTVFPCELLQGDKCSREPRVYDLKVNDDKGDFFFFPDGHASEGYRQNIKKSSWPFEFRCIRWGKNSIRVSKLYSIFAHHVFSFDRGRSIDGSLMLSKPSCLLKHELRLMTNDFDMAQVERRTLQSILTYLSCLKSSNPASAVAKLRQLEKRELYPDELALIYALSSKFSEFGVSAELTPSLLKRMKRACISMIPDSIANFFFEKENFQIKLRNLSFEIANKNMTMERRIYRIENVPRSFSVAVALNEYFSVETPILEDREAMAYHFGHIDLALGERSESRLILSKDRIVFSDPMFYRVGCYKPFSVQRFIRNRASITPLRLCYERIESSRQGEERSENTEVGAPDSTIEIADEIVELEEPVAPLIDESSDFAQTVGHIPIHEMELFKENMLKTSAPRMNRKNHCIFVAIAKFRGVGVYDVLDEVFDMDISDELFDAIDEDRGISQQLIEEIGRLLNITFVCTSDFKDVYFLNRRQGGCEQMFMTVRNNHCELSSKEMFTQLLKQKDGVSKDSPDLFPKQLFSDAKGLISMERALKLLNSLNRGTTGTLKEIDPGFIAKMKEGLSFGQNQMAMIDIYTRFGFAGSGKTHAIIQWFKNTPGLRRMFISPRRNLAEEVEKKLEGTQTLVCTWEVALKRINDGFQEIYVDEITLYPPGYISLLMLCKAFKRIKGASDHARSESFKSLSFLNEKLVLIGDPLQIRYFGQLDNNLLGHESEVDYYLPRKYDYLWQTQRQGSWFKKVIDIPTKQDDSVFECKLHSDCSTLRNVEVILVAAQDEKAAFSSCSRCMTFGESQGLTFHNGKAGIVISHSTLKTSPNACIVAITRAVKGYDLIFHGITPKEALQNSMRSLWNYVIKRENIPIERITNMLKGASFSTEIVGSLEEKAAGDPFIMPFIDLSENIEVEEGECSEAVEAPEWFKCHLPVFDCNPLFSEMFEKVEAKEKREFESMLGFSNQFLDIENKAIKTKENWPMQYQNVFPHHQASDDVTFWAGVKKRIRKSNWTAEKRKLCEVGDLGDKLADVFFSSLPQKFEVSGEDIEFGEISFKNKRAEKSTKMWEAHAERSDIDWSVDRVFMFMKSQFCTKESKMFTTAKAGQTLACFQHLVLFKFGPSLRAIERAFMRAIGDKFYVHSGKNFFALDAFVKMNANMFDGESIESDYEAFDSCQDEIILAFEIALLKRIGMNTAYIMDYTRLKLALGSRMGNLAIMRFTGEFSTFLFNTFANMLFTFLKYDIKKDSRILFAGDDMCSISSLKPRRDGKEKMLERFSLKAIEEKKRYPMFCGWYLTPDGILKSPKLLWARLCMMKQRNLLNQCIDNYLFEAFFAYKLSERLFNILNEEDFEYHYLVTRFFVKESKLLTGASRGLIQEIGTAIGRCQSSTSIDSLAAWNQETSRLMQSGQTSCTKMQPSSTQRCLTVYVGLKPTLKLSLSQEMTCIYLTSNYLTERSLISSKGLRANSSTSTSGQYLSLLGQCSQIQMENQERSSYMMDLVLTMTKVRASSPLKNSASMRTPVTSSSNQGTYCRQRTYILEHAYGSKFQLIAQGMPSTGNLLLLILGWRTDSAIHRDFLTLSKELLDGSHSQFLAVRPLTSQRKLDDQCQEMEEGCRLSQVHQPRTSTKGCSGLQKLEDQEQHLPKRGRKTWKRPQQLSCWEVRALIMQNKENLRITQVYQRRRRGSALGQIENTLGQEVEQRVQAVQNPPLQAFQQNQGVLALAQPQQQRQVRPQGSVLIASAVKLLETMSLKGELRSQRRTHVLTWLWNERINAGNEFNFIGVVQQGVLPAQADALATFRRVSKHYCKYLFGNIAIYGASDVAVYPNVAFETPAFRMNVNVGEPPVPQAINKVWEINLNIIVPLLKAFCRESNVNALSDNTTYRNICEAFADEAYDFLKDAYHERVTTTIYDKWPRAMSNAPWVAFDFASGLDMHRLSVGEKRVIDAMTKRLFRTQGQKSVFEAGAENNLDLEG